MKLDKILYLFVFLMSIILTFNWIIWDSNERDTQYRRISCRDHQIFTISNTTEQTDYFDSAVERNEKRKRNIREQCAVIEETRIRENVPAYKNMPIYIEDFIRGITDERFSFVYCRLNKAASTLAIKTLKRRLGYSTDLFLHYSETFRNLPRDQRRDIFNKAYSFLFVREPYGRLFSTYTNKFYFPKGNWAPVGTEIVRRYRKNPSNNSLHYGHDITFAELIRFTVEEFEAGNKMDDHLRPMHVDCKPCEYNYDFIGKLETIDNDWKYILEQFSARNIKQNEPPFEDEFKRIFAEMLHFFRNLKKMGDSKIDKYSLFKRAWRYYQIAAKISKHIEMPFRRNYKKEIECVKFIEHLEAAAYYSRKNASELKGQKQEAMLQAYSTVPFELLERLRIVVLEDCLLFGYDDRPKWLFDREWQNTSSSTFDYFSDLI